MDTEDPEKVRPVQHQRAGKDVAGENERTKNHRGATAVGGRGSTTSEGGEGGGEGARLPGARLFACRLVGERRASDEKYAIGFLMGLVFFQWCYISGGENI